MTKENDQPPPYRHCPAEATGLALKEMRRRLATIILTKAKAGRRTTMSLDTIRQKLAASPAIVRNLSLFAVLLAYATALIQPVQAIELDTSLIAAPCKNCHAPRPDDQYAIPPIQGQDQKSIAAKLRGFKQEELIGTVMNRIAKGYSDAEIMALAEYFSALPPNRRSTEKKVPRQ